MKKLPLSAAVSAGIAFALCSLPPFAMGEYVMEEIIVVDNRIDAEQLDINLSNSSSTDSAELLRTIPGANVNSLGALTGIAQYRGLYGDRVAVTLDNSPLFSGGPNAMDAPLSYVPTGMIKELKVTRGIAPVSAAQESIGGHISAQLNRGDFTRSDHFANNLQLNSQYRSVNNASTTTLRNTLANKTHKLNLLSNHTESDDVKYGNGTIDSTAYQRSRHDLSYAFTGDDTELLIYGGKNNTEKSGTPALPMDINYIDTDLAGLNISSVIAGTKVSSHLSYSDVKHGMDNYSFRPAPMMAMSYRTNTATAKHLAGNLYAETPYMDGFFKIGIDYSHKDQDSTITNPNNSAFAVQNFNDIKRKISGIFSEWQGDIGELSISIGVRHNQVDMNAGLVGATGMMGTMTDMTNMLSMAFNNGDRDLEFSYTDIVFNSELQLSNNISLDLGLARKHRAPSYQESYLWLPLPSAGGLADGRSYIGNLQLDEERSDEITLGLTWQNDSYHLTPQVFYRDVKNYIQGTPTTNTTANMLSSMMSGAPALQFNNVNAKLYGFDAGYGYKISANWQLDGVISYVRGKRKDISDNLYRLAPLNHRLSLQYQQELWKVQLESVLYDKQDSVSRYNNEQKTAGYGLISLRSEYDISDTILLSAGIENLFDNSYQDHLAGYNRIRNSDIAVGERLYGQGRNIYFAIQLNL